MTPYLTRLAIEASYRRKEIQHNHDAWMMYHGAILSIPNKKSLPKLSEFLIDTSKPKKEVKGIDESAILARFKSYNKWVKNGTGS